MSEQGNRPRRGRALLVAGAGLVVVTVGCGPFVTGNLKPYICATDGGDPNPNCNRPDAGQADAGPDGGQPDGGDGGQ